jgi:site-specific DNA-methyltransferase (adenine-specific)
VPGTRTAFRTTVVGRQTVMLGDCLARMAEMAEGSVDVIVTSPPYNIGVRYGAFADTQPRHEYLRWMSHVADAFARILSAEGSIFLNIGGSNADPWVPFDVAAVFRGRFVLQNHIQWVKSIAVGDDTVGHFKPIHSRRYLNHNHEAIFHFTRGGDVALDRLAVGVPFKDKSNIARFGHAEDRRCAGNTWFIPYRTVTSKAEKFHHPAGFPVELPLRCLRLHGKAAARVLDPFMGTGSTLVAAERLGMDGTGIDVDADYVERSITRLAEEAAGG